MYISRKLYGEYLNGLTQKSLDFILFCKTNFRGFNSIRATVVHQQILAFASRVMPTAGRRE